MAKAKPEPDENEPNADGWDAITTACEALYPKQTNPPHFAACPPARLGPDQLQGVSAYKAIAPTKHWHFATYGFSELHGKESDDPAVSGWGFELTFRLPRKAMDAQPPNWAINFLFNLGRYVKRSGNPFDAGHYMDLNGPIAVGTDTTIRAIAFVPDPQLGKIRTPNGSLQFLQVVGLTLDEYHACGDWQTERVMNLLRKRDPLLVTDLNRPSLLDDPAAAKKVEAGIDRDGSQSESTFVNVADWKKVGAKATVTLGAKAVQALQRKLRSRLLHGRNHALIGKKRAVNFAAGKRSRAATKGDELTVTLSPEAVQRLTAELLPARGRYTWPELKDVSFVVKPTEITDADGNVVKVIG